MALVVACTFSAAGGGGGESGGSGSTGPASTVDTAHDASAVTTAATADGSTAGAADESSGATGGDGDTGGGDTNGTTTDATTTGVEGPCAEAMCAAEASCDDGSGVAVCTCNDGFFGDGQTCTALELPVLRVELPCLAGGCGDPGCQMQETAAAAATLVGDPTVVYDVTLRFRGVVEQNEYVGPGQDGFFHPNAAPPAPGWNEFRLQVPEPAGTYYLNSGATGVLQCFELDMQHTIAVRGGEELALSANNGFDSCGVLNMDAQGQPVVVPGIPPAPSAFDGQFIQIDVVDIAPQ